jgi:hypothetical protein
MTEATEDDTCIFPGCDRPKVPRHELGGPRPHFCDLEEHNASSTHLARKAAAEAEEAAAGSKAG